MDGAKMEVKPRGEAERTRDFMKKKAGRSML